MSERPPAGHRTMPHTADVRIEAWAPSREECVAEAVLGMVDAFADVSSAGPAEPVEVRIDPGPADQLLVGVLDEVIFRMDTAGQLPVGAEVAARDGGLDVRLRMVDADRVEVTGAVPKAVSLHELRFDRDDAGWSCGVTLDV